MPVLSRKNWYAAHRWMGLIVGLQMLAWSIGGLAFSLLDIETVRGNADRRDDPPPVVTLTSNLLTPGEAVQSATNAGIDTSTVARITIRQRFNQPAYELYDQKNKAICAVDAGSGEVTRAISEQRAQLIAEEDFSKPAQARSVELLKGKPPLAFRGGPMPVYRAIMDNPANTHIYISPVTGKVLSRRNDQWRWFDFFWMLHIMDYSERHNFNHWLLTGMAILAVTTSGSGLILWWWRAPCRARWQRRRRHNALQTTN